MVIANNDNIYNDGRQKVTASAAGRGISKSVAVAAEAAGEHKYMHVAGSSPSRLQQRIEF